nr:immunoglobulin light chain junction region [Macaca mulatta]MOY03409.1 immunoglobulin light chain junction region [Macaca mulatta]
CQQYRDLLFSF